MSIWCVDHGGRCKKMGSISPREGFETTLFAIPYNLCSLMQWPPSVLTCLCGPLIWEVNADYYTRSPRNKYKPDKIDYSCLRLPGYSQCTCTHTHIYIYIHQQGKFTINAAYILYRMRIKKPVSWEWCKQIEIIVSRKDFYPHSLPFQG